ncbi:hypothetical protein C8A01DRAFT_18864 [Parachaetomium inaequale]|uniref:Uncharacterized protein n=1 Tax=Parachaetomium inaequale TaxID=2588326 RepID=A0AAN6P9N8_9PEZI|nr:hypothetical protein C8A01DRAFT_18864 [Parachaetomium inaequale]
MCILRIPQHPWCHCADPTAVDIDGKPTCPHHIRIRPDSLKPFIGPESTAPLEAHLAAFLSRIHRPAPTWQHCTLYRTKHTDESGTFLPPTDDDELSCPATQLRKERHGGSDGRFKEFYLWEGLCSACEGPSSRIALPLVPLRERWVEEDPDADSYSGAGERWGELVLDGWEQQLDGEKVDEMLTLRMMVWLGSGAEHGHDHVGEGRGAFVDVVVEEEKEGEGTWVVNEARSAVYSPPGFYDPEPAGESEKRKPSGLKTAALAGVVMAGQLARRLVKQRKLNGL